METGYLTLDFVPSFALPGVDYVSLLGTVKTDKVPTLEQLQSYVGGYIEPMFTIPSTTRKNHSITGYVNEEGLLIGLPVIGSVVDNHGVRPFAGNMVIVGLNDETGDTVLLTDEEIEWVRNRFRADSSLNLLQFKH